MNISTVENTQCEQNLSLVEGSMDTFAISLKTFMSHACSEDS